MDLRHEFTVAVPIADAWRILTDLERIAPCLPGAQLTEVEGDTYRGHVGVKVGPVVAQFKGQASFIERNDATYTAALKGEGRDTGGKGNASAVITASLTSESATSTRCNVHTDLTISGKVAQFGRGALADVSDKLLAQFVDNLNTLIASGGIGAASGTTTPAAAPSRRRRCHTGHRLPSRPSPTSMGAGTTSTIRSSKSRPSWRSRGRRR